MKGLRKINNKIEIKNNKLIVTPQGLDKVWSFTNKLEIPMTNVIGAKMDQNILNTKKGFRAPGLGLPNKWSGTYILDGEKNFWNATRNTPPIVIQLKNEKYSRLILSIENATEWVDKINTFIV